MHRLLHRILEKELFHAFIFLRSFVSFFLATLLARRIIAYRRNRARAAELAREEAAVEEGEAGYEDRDDMLPDPQETTRLIPTTSNGDVSQEGTQVDNGYGGAHSCNATVNIKVK
ncbi:hypothetical protein FP744_10000624 [Trichoderma asperellum]|nr:hypothetical protein LI328DRAFT_135874 [Trichoderma asperelloides]